ncbi:YCF48-related protein [Aequorivita todarodis]|uniref:T9SS type A sorting domain-containing protein n=1 Tax=Aequorivita todarodis TaxID=2036821 RepID=UPI00235098F8|nr:YCF48-related protein [Aequorivita todarodis]MDC7999503.1 YCF48-related protein [Aequorivita todarodis]
MKKTILFVLTCVLFNTASAQQGWFYSAFIPTENHHGAIATITEDIAVAVVDGGDFYKTTDGGAIWNIFESGINQEFYDLAFADANLGFAVGAEGAMLKTNDGGDTWAQISTSITVKLYAIGIASADNIWAVGDAGVVLHSTNGGNTWSLDTTLSTERLNSIAFRDENTGYIAGDHGELLFTANGGSTWEPIPEIDTQKDLLKINATANFVQILAGVSGDVPLREGDETFKSSDNITWTTYQAPIFAPTASDLYFFDDAIGFTISSQNALCNCCYIEVLKTEDSGEQWNTSYFGNDIGTVCNAFFGYADIAFATDLTGYFFIGNLIYKTVDGGTETVIIVNTEDFNKPKDFALYPNPTQGNNLTVALTNINTSDLLLNITDITGKTVYSTTELGNNTTLNISGLANGLYFVTLKEDGKPLVYKKLIKN